MERTSGRVPDFFIVGHPKCGTTALYEMLRRHPQIYMPDFKEPWFFAQDMRPRFQPARSGVVPETLDGLCASVRAAPAPDQRVGEASSSYLRSREPASAIAKSAPDARIIAILREPASFLTFAASPDARRSHRDEKDLQGGDRCESWRGEKGARSRDARICRRC